MASSTGSGVGSSSSNAGGGSRSGGSSNAVQMLNTARMVSGDDDEKKPLWRYVHKVALTGKGQGGNAKFRCRLCDREMNGSYSRVKAHLLKWSNKGVNQCPKVTVDVLAQLKAEQDRADALVLSQVPKDIPLPTNGVSGRKRRGSSAIEASFHSEERS